MNLPALQSKKVKLPTTFSMWVVCLDNTMSGNKAWKTGEEGLIKEGGEIVITEIVDNRSIVALYDPEVEAYGTNLPKCKVYIENALEFLERLVRASNKAKLFDFLNNDNT